MKHLASLAALLGVLGAQSASAEDAPSPARPHWNVDGSGKQCVLSRGAETPAGVTMALRTYPASGYVDLLLIGPRWPNALRAEGAQLTFKFTAPGDTLSHPVSLLPLQGAGQAIQADHLPWAFVEDVAHAASLTIASQNAALATIALPSGDKAVQAWHYCERAKLVEWGADEALLDPSARPPQTIGDTRNWIDLHRLHAFHTLANYTFRFFSVAKLAIATDGKVEQCTTLDSAGQHDVDLFVCSELMAHARYEPARDKNGAPIRGVAVVPLNMQIRASVEVMPG